MALAAYVDEFSRQPWRGLFLLSGAGVGCLLFTEVHHQNFALAWATMLCAMMPPLLAHPITHILRSSRTSQRIRALSMFALGYVLVWMLAGMLLAWVSLLFRTFGSGSLAAAVAVTGMALTWSGTPWHQAALNRGHRVQNLAVFGWQADLNAISYGLVHGAWCFAACWAWMLVPMVVADHDAMLMIFVTFVMLVERLAPPAKPEWRMPFPLRLLVNRFAHV